MVKKNKGFTLIELIVTIAIAGIIFSTLISIIPFVYEVEYHRRRFGTGTGVGTDEVKGNRKPITVCKYIEN